MKNKPTNKTSLVLPIIFGTFVIVIGAILASQFGSLLTGSAFKPPGNIFMKPPATKPSILTLPGPDTTINNCILNPKQTNELTKKLSLIDFEISLLFAQQQIVIDRLYNSNISYSAQEKRVLEEQINKFNKEVEVLQLEKEKARGDLLANCVPTGSSDPL